MRVHKHILSIRKHSRVDTPKQDLWFYSGDSVTNQLQSTEKKSIRNDRASIFNDDYTRYSQGNSELTKPKKECSFVVDWQLEDTF